LIDALHKKTGFRRLSDCNGGSGWPHRGVYFFFTNGEVRDCGNSLRVVRVGTHAVSNESQTTLWHRLRAHRGTIKGANMGGGNHRGSIFRKRVGAALVRRGGVQPHICSSWGMGKTAVKEICQAEYPLEQAVSEYICAMPFLWLGIDDEAGSTSHRKAIEANSIALISNYGREPMHPPSREWLGLHSEQDTIRESGLWNSDHVQQNWDPAFLKLLHCYIEQM
jgi:hypothetical protein